MKDDEKILEMPKVPQEAWDYLDLINKSVSDILTNGAYLRTESKPLTLADISRSLMYINNVLPQVDPWSTLVMEEALSREFTDVANAGEYQLHSVMGVRVETSPFFPPNCIGVKNEKGELVKIIIIDRGAKEAK